MHFCEDYVSGTIEKEKTGSVLVMRFDLLPSSILYKFLEGIKVLPDLLFFSPNLRLGSFADLFEEKKTVPTDLQHILEIQRGRARERKNVAKTTSRTPTVRGCEHSLNQLSLTLIAGSIFKTWISKHLVL